MSYAKIARFWHCPLRPYYHYPLPLPSGNLGQYSLESLVMMTIHVAGKKIKYSHIHKVKQSSALIVGWNIAYLEIESNAKLNCSPKEETRRGGAEMLYEEEYLN